MFWDFGPLEYIKYNEWKRYAKKRPSVPGFKDIGYNESDICEAGTPAGFNFMRKDGDYIYLEAMPFSEKNLQRQIFSVLQNRKIAKTEDGKRVFSRLIAPLIPSPVFEINMDYKGGGELTIDIKTNGVKDGTN